MATVQSGEAIRSRLANIVGPSHLLGPEQAEVYSLDGEQPLAAVFPAEEREAAEVARLTDEERVLVVTWGGGTKQGIEPVQPREGILLGTRRLDRTVELDVANLTVTVGAGQVVDDLQRELAGVRLFLPLDPVDSGSSTVGGTLAANSSGSNRLLYRTARDWVLGLGMVTPAGKVIRVGRKTVKDVAGYDMKKLYLGSWGTLGAITEATFRLLPLPETSTTVATLFPSLSGASTAVSRLLASFMRPSAADLLSASLAPAAAREALPIQAGEYLLMVAFEGVQEAVVRQKREWLELATAAGARESALFEGAPEKELWQQRKGVLVERPRGKAAMLVKGSVLLQRVFEFAGSLVDCAAQEGLEVSLASHAGNGIVYALVATGPSQQDRLVSAADRVQRLAGDCGGFAMVQKAPRGITERVRVWPPRSDYGLMRRIKAQLDPNNLWNPARTPGGAGA